MIMEMHRSRPFVSCRRAPQLLSRDLGPHSANRRLSSINCDYKREHVWLTHIYIWTLERRFCLSPFCRDLQFSLSKVSFTVLLSTHAMGLKTVYVGPIIQSKSLTELDINLHGSIGVDENGKILFVERDQLSRSDQEWMDADFVHLGENEFFFPGFIGTIATCLSSG